jgi:hypothetical protein
MYYSKPHTIKHHSLFEDIPRPRYGEKIWKIQEPKNKTLKQLLSKERVKKNINNKRKTIKFV